MNTKKGYGFGTAPVFLAAISTILGAILFLRFGYAVAHTGLLGSLIIIFVGHAITIPTALAIAEIATNLRVEGGGEYFIISRSFGPMIGGTIGISLYLSQAVSVAFYMIAFSEAFKLPLEWIFPDKNYHDYIWIISVPGTILLLWIILKKGANIGVTALWIVAAILGVSLVLFFLGSADSSSSHQFKDISATVKDPDSFFLVFAIIFPAFTGMTAGVGLSGDLKNPRKSIPLGTLSATLAGMLIYVLVVVKYSLNMSPDEMAADQFAMSKIALWGPIIYIGLAAASLSSAIGSILIAPRTLQALGNDSILPLTAVNRFLGSGRPETNEPVNATLVTAVIALFFVSLGSIDFVAQIISMFFMITYGSLCLVSFLEHFAGNPSYRPTFRSKWYLSLLGALACFIMMFQMAPLYALVAVIAIIIIYITITRSREEEDDLSAMLRGVLFQLTRKLQILIQRNQTPTAFSGWRPSVIAMSSSSLTRLAPFDLLRWISHYYGFGTFIHYINGFLDEKSN
jgi:amino acid transporter